MPKTDPRSANLTDAPDHGHEGRFARTRPGAYILVVLAVALGACAYSLRSFSILNCQATGYESDRYLAYCGAKNYGDYDYGAFWFGLEPDAIGAATNSRVLLLGNSRMQFGLSAAATDEWFASLPARYYLLGFAYNGNYKFEAPLLRKLQPKAEAYVINIDLFFEQSESPPARTVMREGGAQSRYEQKRAWQRIHKPFCARLPSVCGNGIAFFRSPLTGAWVVTGRGFASKPVSYDQSVDQSIVEGYTTAGNEFLSHLSVSRECVILTMVPTVNTSIGTAKAIASAMRLTLIAPELTGLNTFDESHLDRPSAERWSTAFIEAAGPKIRKCLDESPRSLGQSRTR